MGLLGLATHGATNLLCKLYKQSLKANGIIRMQILELEYFFYSLFGSFRTIRFSHKAVRVRVRYRLIRRPVASVRGVIQSTFPFLKS